jgi:hypothetical protein
MKILLTVAGIVLIGFLGLQTRETAKARNVSLTCVAAEAESIDCVSLGPLGGVNPSGVEFWVTSFIDRSVELPRALGDMLREQTRGRYF